MVTINQVPDYSEIVECFRGIDKIYSVFTSVNGVYDVIIFLNQNQYDDDLMDCLLDREAIILDRYKNQLFQFYYLPTMN